MFLGNHSVLHIMGTKTRLYAGIICNSTLHFETSYARQTSWLSFFGTPNSVRKDDTFNHAVSINLVTSFGSKLKPLPSRRHQKDILEPKHGVLRSIFIRKSKENELVNERICIALVFNISNQLYGSDTMSTYKMAHELSKPIADYPVQLHSDFLDAQSTFEAKRKLT